MTLRLNGRDVDGGGTLLHVCRREGVKVPALCHDERVDVGGHCRACMVEVDGRLQPACTTASRDGTVVETESERVRSYRRDLGELIAAECTPKGRVAAFLKDWGVRGTRYRSGARPPSRRDDGHPLLRLDMSACILCRLCVRVCAQIQGQFVYAVEGRGPDARLSWADRALAATDCVSCGLCAAVCPSGAISDLDRQSVTVSSTGQSTAQAADRIVRTTCAYCGVGCQLEVAVRDDDVAWIEGADSAVNSGHLCVKGRYAHSFVRHPDRLTTPLLRRGQRLEPASWREAIAFVASELPRFAGRAAFLASSRCTNEENYLLQKWARVAHHTNNVDCCARVCHAPSAAGMRKSFGTGAATNSLADMEKADVLFVCGSNTTDSHPVVGARVKQAVLAGASLIVVDPRRTELAALADVHLAPRAGTNVPLLNSLAAVIVEEKLYDRDFVTRRAEGFDELVAFLRRYRPRRTEAITGVPEGAVRAAARLYAKAHRPMQLHGLGVTEHLQGSESVMLLCNLALLCGAVGREGVGVNPLRGQNNVQGAADMGCQPDLLPGYVPVADAEARRRFEQAWGGPLPSQPGLTLPRIYEAIGDGRIGALFVMGENPLQTEPDAQRVRERLARLDLLVVEDLFLSETARLAHVVLPGASAFEKNGTFTNTERRVQRVRRVVAPPGQARADEDILCDLMRASGMDVRYGGPREIFEEICSLTPMLEAAGYDAIDAQGLQWPVTSMHPHGTAILHSDGFRLEKDGRARLHCVDFQASPALTDAWGPLRLVTGRVLEHYNSGSMTRRSPVLGLARKDLLEIHPSDARAREIGDGEPVRVSSRFGEAAAAAAVTEAVPPGTVFLSFHFPETGTNRVTSDVLDRLADCPEYKVTAVEVRRGK